MSKICPKTQVIRIKDKICVILGTHHYKPVDEGDINITNIEQLEYALLENLENGIGTIDMSSLLNWLDFKGIPFDTLEDEINI